MYKIIVSSLSDNALITRYGFKKNSMDDIYYYHNNGYEIVDIFKLSFSWKIFTKCLKKYTRFN